MSKISIIGPKDLRMEVLAILQELGILHIDKSIKTESHENIDPLLKSHTIDAKSLTEKFFFEKLTDKIDTLLNCLPRVKARDSFLSPDAAFDFLTDVVEKHISSCRELTNKKELLADELKNLSKHKKFITAIARLLPDEDVSHDLDYLGVTIKNEKYLESLEKLLTEKIGRNFAIATTPDEKGALLVLITTKKELSGTIHDLLQNATIAEQKLPPSLADLPFAEQIKEARKLIHAKEEELAAIDLKLQKFAYSWSDVYQDLKKWLVNKLSILQATASLFETDMCFIVFGWLPTIDVPKLSKQLQEKFGGKVVVEEKEIQEHDLERVPTIIKNPPYFQPFELFSRLLPVPSYGSFDVTPFIAIFFPVFFGMMLGDIGYGIILFLLAALLKARCKQNRTIIDIAGILTISSIYTIIFGCFFGELFGNLGTKLLGLKPVYLDRHHSIMPMLYFALAMGIVHVVIGLLLGVLSAVRKKMKKEALFKGFSILLILLITCVAISIFVESFPVLPRSLIIVILAIMPVLLLTGGLLAPLEVLKHIGNIISYARIMAIGLTSVLLAYVANHLAGMTGSIWLGIFVAITLHAFNLVLGVFAPTIHSLRLHYVEFLSKFMEKSGTAFKPLEKE
jgi:V/A-type H+-transporting ATPase subunit I